eukprot:914274-Pelagomonas_calceolata.AAC.1
MAPLLCHTCKHRHSHPQFHAKYTVQHLILMSFEVQYRTWDRIREVQAPSCMSGLPELRQGKVRGVGIES